MSDELVVSYLFPPSRDISGIVLSKRIITKNKKVDLLTTSKYSSDDLFTDLIEEYINHRFIVTVDNERDSPKAIKEFVNSSFKLISKEYKTVTSRSWSMSNHFFALEYKLKYPNTFWRAEFSDPLLYGIDNKINKKSKHKINSPGFFKRINEKIPEGFPGLENNSTTFFTVEYLTFLFADEIIFTNTNQRDLMVGQFPVDVKSTVLNKSVISPHPTLFQDFYNKTDCKLSLDDNYINLAYFGDYYYGNRHFEGIFHALESLNHKFKNKIRLYIFISNTKILKDLIKPLEFGDNIFIKKPLEYLEFLNASTKFDVLIVNDLYTGDAWPENPYLPSKLSDYLGSKTDIWAVSEPGSSLDKISVKYKSHIDDFTSNTDVLVRILEDNGYNDDNFTFSDDYFFKRLTYLNSLLEKSYNKTPPVKSEDSLIKRAISWLKYQ